MIAVTQKAAAKEEALGGWLFSFLKVSILEPEVKAAEVCKTSPLLTPVRLSGHASSLLFTWK